MAMTSIPAIVGFSLWSDYAFKVPLLSSSMFLCVGSFFGACAPYYGSLAMALVGRGLCGMGTSEALNRRLLGDTPRQF